MSNEPGCNYLRNLRADVYVEAEASYVAGFPVPLRLRLVRLRLVVLLVSYSTLAVTRARPIART